MTGGETTEKVIGELLAKLYAGFYVYAAISYMVWLPVLAGYMIISTTSWFQSLPDTRKGLVSMAYWLGLAFIVVLLFFMRYWKGYINRMAAKLGVLERTRDCWKYNLLWILGSALIIVLNALLGGTLGHRAIGFSVLVGLSIGNLGTAMLERCYGERSPASAYASIVLALGSMGAVITTSGVVEGIMYTSAVIILAYGLTIIQYLFKTLTSIA